MYTEFLTKFGHRCLREFDLLSIPWKEDRKPLISTLQAMVEVGVSLHSETSNRLNQQQTSQPQGLDIVFDGLNRRIKPMTRRILKFILPYTHGSTALREKAKSLGIGRVHENRKAYRNLDDEMAKEGRLPDTE